MQFFQSILILLKIITPAFRSKMSWRPLFSFVHAVFSLALNFFHINLSLVGVVASVGVPSPQAVSPLLIFFLLCHYPVVGYSCVVWIMLLCAVCSVMLDRFQSLVGLFATSPPHSSPLVVLGWLGVLFLNFLFVFFLIFLFFGYISFPHFDSRLIKKTLGVVPLSGPCLWVRSGR